MGCYKGAWVPCGNKKWAIITRWLEIPLYGRECDYSTSSGRGLGAFSGVWVWVVVYCEYGRNVSCIRCDLSIRYRWDWVYGRQQVRTSFLWTQQDKDRVICKSCFHCHVCELCIRCVQRQYELFVYACLFQLYSQRDYTIWLSCTHGQTTKFPIKELVVICKSVHKQIFWRKISGRSYSRRSSGMPEIPPCVSLLPQPFSSFWRLGIKEKATLKCVPNCMCPGSPGPICPFRYLFVNNIRHFCRVQKRLFRRFGDIKARRIPPWQSVPL